MFKKILFFSILCFGIINAQEIKIPETMRANFTQKIVSDGQVIAYEGEIFTKSPNNVLWKYQKPIPKEIYIQQNLMITYEPRLQQAIFTNLKENLDIFTLINNAKKLKDNYYKAEILGQEYFLTFQKGILEKITFQDSLQNEVEIVFYNIQVNPPLKAEIFDFKPTSDIDILYN